MHFNDSTLVPVTVKARFLCEREFFLTLFFVSSGWDLGDHEQKTRETGRTKRDSGLI